jgi:hypothetical protein
MHDHSLTPSLNPPRPAPESEPDRFFELLKIMQKVQVGEMSCRAGARKFLSQNDG